MDTFWESIQQKSQDATSSMAGQTSGFNMFKGAAVSCCYDLFISIWWIGIGLDCHGLSQLVTGRRFIGFTMFYKSCFINFDGKFESCVSALRPELGVQLLPLTRRQTDLVGSYPALRCLDRLGSSWINAKFWVQHGSALKRILCRCWQGIKA